jgi:co-chaperonin GroES (HSP10)
MEPAPVNTTGINPTEYKVLIAPKPIEEKRGSIILPGSAVESEKYASVEGTIIATSPLAFTYAEQHEWDAVGAIKPKAGDRVIYAKYAGVRVKSPKDGQEYLLINDKDLVATVED